jgi:hypothetical protein
MVIAMGPARIVRPMLKDVDDIKDLCKQVRGARGAVAVAGGVDSADRPPSTHTARPKPCQAQQYPLAASVCAASLNPQR